jgi:hypothetical protein
MLNEYQRNSLRVVMHLIEEKMREIERLLDRPEEAGLMYDLKNDVTPETAKALRKMVPTIYARIGDLRDRLDLPRKTKAASRELLKGVPQLWVMLEESYSKQLRRYGEVDPRLAAELDPQIEALATLMLELEELAMGHARDLLTLPSRPR